MSLMSPSLLWGQNSQRQYQRWKNQLQDLILRFSSLFYLWPFTKSTLEYVQQVHPTIRILSVLYWLKSAQNFANKENLVTSCWNLKAAQTDRKTIKSQPPRALGTTTLSIPSEHRLIHSKFSNWSEMSTIWIASCCEEVQKVTAPFFLWWLVQVL